ncbi:MAG: hypothetical protein JO175_08670 [Candidatus Eremiobacteraeota bacterium]|nr:hypothetical protein [Candidatus Eremiobacteraeota bacterium]
MIIALEGLDASGKHTQSQRIAERVRAANRRARVFSFPRYDTPTGALIKKLLVGDVTVSGAPLDEALLFQALHLADKACAIREMKSYFDEGGVVICDRWISSGIAYAIADGLDPELIKSMSYLLSDPDVNVFIDIPPEEALRRRPDVRDRYERDREKQACVRENYQSMWGGQIGEAIVESHELYETWWVRVDGMGTEREVTDRIWSAVTAHPSWQALDEVAPVQ